MTYNCGGCDEDLSLLPPAADDAPASNLAFLPAGLSVLPFSRFFPVNISIRCHKCEDCGQQCNMILTSLYTCKDLQ